MIDAINVLLTLGIVALAFIIWMVFENKDIPRYPTAGAVLNLQTTYPNTFSVGSAPIGFGPGTTTSNDDAEVTLYY